MMIDARWTTVALFATTMAVATPRMGHAQEISKDLGLITLRASLEASAGLYGTTTTNLGFGYEALVTDGTGVGFSLDWRRVDSGGYVESSSELGASLAWYVRPHKDDSPFMTLRAGIGFANQNDPVLDDNNPPFVGGSLGYLKLVGSDRFGAGFRLELLYAHRFSGDRVSGDIIYNGYGVDDFSVALGLTLYFRKGSASATTSASDVVRPPAVR